MPYSWRNSLSTTVDTFLQVLSKWLEHFVEDEFIIEPCLDVVVICHRTGRKQACAANEGGSEHPQQDLFHK